MDTDMDTDTDTDTPNVSTIHAPPSLALALAPSFTRRSACRSVGWCRRPVSLGGGVIRVVAQATHGHPLGAYLYLATSSTSAKSSAGAYATTGEKWPDP